MSTNTKGTSSSIGFAGLLGLLFIGLKLTHYIDWSWWWVLAPLWMPVAAVLLICIIACFVVLARAARK